MDEWITFGETKQDVKDIWQALELWVPYPSLMEGNYACIGAMCVPCMSRMYNNTMRLLRERPRRLPEQPSAQRLQETISRGLIHALSQQLLQKLCHREEAQEAYSRQQAALHRHQEEVITMARNLLLSCNISGIVLAT